MTHYAAYSALTNEIKRIYHECEGRIENRLSEIILNLG